VTPLGLDLHIIPGERIVLTGANGTGKTTLLRALAGLAPSTRRIHPRSAGWPSRPHGHRGRLIAHDRQA
jgi:ABC-type transport system involved in cytochrome c biogenesis ATPase subunit